MYSFKNIYMPWRSRIGEDPKESQMERDWTNGPSETEQLVLLELS